MVVNTTWLLRWLPWLHKLASRRNGLHVKPRPSVNDIVHYTLDGTPGKDGLTLCGQKIASGIVQGHTSAWNDPRGCSACLANYYRLKEVNGNVPLPVR